MAFIKELPEWNAAGVKPTQTKLDSGWTVAEKPPADWFNWQQFTTYKAIQELQQGAIHKDGSVNFTASPTVPTQTAGDDSQKLANTAYVDLMAYNTPTPTAVNLGNGVQVVTVPKGSPYNVLNITGHTLVNLLGRDGNCEDTSKWSVYSTATIALDTTNKLYGSNAFKITIGTSQTTGGILRSIFAQLVANRYYLATADVKNGNATNIRMQINQSSGVNGNAITGTTSFAQTYNTFQFTGAYADLYVYATGTAGQYAYVDGVRVYEITTTEKTYIDGLSVANAQAYIAAKYPYVDDVKHVNAPVVIKYGENLLSTFDQWILTSGGNTQTIVEPYKFTAKGKTAGTYAGYQFDAPVVGGQTYTLSYTVNIANIGGTVGNGAYHDFTPFDANGNSLGNMAVAPYATANGTTNTSATFTVPANAVSVHISLTVLNTVTGDFTFSNPMLNLGTTAKPFKPRNDDMLAFPNIQLASSVDGTVYDTLFKRDGKYFVEHRFKKDVILDGSVAWANGTDYGGFKSVSFPVPTNALPSSTADKMITKYDGKVVKGTTSITTDNLPDLFSVSSNININMSIADTDSGWGESYMPTADEIKAYFYGWVMSDINGNLYTSGTKYWTEVYTGIGGSTTFPTGKKVAATGPTTTLPTTTNKQVGWTPYKLTYQLATPTFEEIQVDAGMSLHEGLNQIEVGQGVVVREKVTPALLASNYVLNYTGTQSTMLKNRTNRVITVFKNGKDANWIKETNAVYYGGQGAYTPQANFDPTATYEVSYLALDQYLLSASVQAVTGETASNLKTVVDTLSMNQADQDARISAAEILARQIYNVPQKTTAAMNLYVDGTNGADSNDGSAGKPFKTIQRAINSVPQIVNHVVTVNVAAGTYAEDLIITGFSGAEAVIIVGDTVASTSRTISSVLAKNNATSISFKGFNLTFAGGSAVYVTACLRVSLANLNIVSSATAANGVYCDTSKVYVTTSVISNRLNAFSTSVNGEILTDINSGTGNTNATYAQYGGKIARNGTQPAGINAALYGGINTSDSGVLNPWGDNTATQRPSLSAIGQVTTPQSISANTVTKVQFPQERSDILGNFDAVTNHRFTAPQGGVYQVNVIVFLTSLTSGSVNELFLYVNGSLYRRLDYFVPSTTSHQSLKGSTAVTVSTNDYLEIYVKSSIATTVAAGTDTALEVTRIA